MDIKDNIAIVVRSKPKNHAMMRVLKRSGSLEDVSFDKVLTRLRLLSDKLDVNVYELAQKVCSRIFDGVMTSELDELAAQMCSSLIIEHPDYDKLASRISCSNHHKNTSPSYSETTSILFANGLINERIYDMVQKNKEKLNSSIDYSRDFTYDYFGFKTLERSYLLKVDGKPVERVQHMLMRVALGIHGQDLKDALQTYDLMSRKLFIHATPTLFNAGTNREQMSSCFLIHLESDSIDGIFNTLKDCAMISKYAGGIGMHIHNVRAKDAVIRGTNGISSGIIPMLRVFNNTARYVNQAGKRNGSIAVFLEPWHADIECFLELRKNHGAEEDALAWRMYLGRPLTAFTSGMRLRDEATRRSKPRTFGSKSWSLRSKRELRILASKTTSTGRRTSRTSALSSRLIFAWRSARCRSRMRWPFATWRAYA